MFGDPQLNEKAWEVVPLSEIAEYYNGLTYRPEDVADSGVVVLRSSNIQNSELDFSDIVRVSCDVRNRHLRRHHDTLNYRENPLQTLHRHSIRSKCAARSAVLVS